jgi:hypothetical protein
MSVTSSSADGTENSYAAQIDGSPVLTVYSESDGSGGTKNRGVVINSIVGAQSDGGYTIRQYHARASSGGTVEIGVLDIPQQRVVSVEVMVNAADEEFLNCLGGTAIGTFKVIGSGSLTTVGSVRYSLNKEEQATNFYIDLDTTNNRIRFMGTSGGDDFDWAITVRYMMTSWEG